MKNQKDSEVSALLHEPATETRKLLREADNEAQASGGDPQEKR